MITCFVFLDSCDEEGYLSACVDEAGEVHEPLKKRTKAAINQIQAVASNTWVVAPTDTAVIHVLNLPWLGERKSREALPYALEDQVAQPTTSLHFAFDKAHYHRGEYLVVVIDKKMLMNWVSRLNEAGIVFDGVTLDWFALHADEVFHTSRGLLVYHPQFKGALSKSLAQNYLIQQRDYSGYSFVDSCSDMSAQHLEPTEDVSHLFIAKRLVSALGIDLCRGLLAHPKRRMNQFSWKLCACALFVLWLGSGVLVNTVRLYQLAHYQAPLQTDIDTIYHAFLPDAPLVSTPKLAIEQTLKKNPLYNEKSIWSYLSKLAPEFKTSKNISIEQLMFQNETLTLQLKSLDFNALEKFETRLKQKALLVNQVKAVSHEAHVEAILELKS